MLKQQQMFHQSQKETERNYIHLFFRNMTHNYHIINFIHLEGIPENINTIKAGIIFAINKMTGSNI